MHGTQNTKSKTCICFRNFLLDMPKTMVSKMCCIITCLQHLTGAWNQRRWSFRRRRRRGGGQKRKCHVTWNEWRFSMTRIDRRWSLVTLVAVLTVISTTCNMRRRQGPKIYEQEQKTVGMQTILESKFQPSVLQ